MFCKQTFHTLHQPIAYNQATKF